MARPTPPTTVRINGVAETNAMATRDSGTISVSAAVNDPDGQRCRLRVTYSTSSSFTAPKTVHSDWVKDGFRAGVSLTGLTVNTRYYLRLWTIDSKGNYSSNYNAANFWTKRYSNPPEIVTPADNVQIDANNALVFDWRHTDPDDAGLTNPQDPTGYEIRWREAGTPYAPAGEWASHRRINTSATTGSIPAKTLKPSATYEWQVRTRDLQILWGYWSPIRSITTIGVTKTPLLVTPGADIAVFSDQERLFEWTFRDPLPASTQGNADIRYRVIGSPTWTLIAGSALTEEEWLFPADTFVPGYHYEWQVATYRSTGTEPLSPWSPSGTFWAIPTPGALAAPVDPGADRPQPALGIGTHRVHIFDQGGIVHRGELTQFTSIEWGRVRDEISSAEIVIEQFNRQTRDLLAQLTTWRYEVVIYRDDDRVWEGPITHLTDGPGKFIIGAKDPMVYLYRRIMRQGYNDSYRIVKGKQMGMKTVVQRAGIITVNALAYHDPNVLPYLSLIETGADAQQTRVTPDFSKTAWEEIDDLAANHGLDYTCVGRRIIYWDTHTGIGTLPEMRDGDFSERPIVTEYGMSLADFLAATDGQGIYGATYPTGKTLADWDEYYGPVEMLISGYGNETLVTDVPTPAQIAALQGTLRQQARRSINSRYPAPRIARVPDNATISPNVNVGINQLVPGVWIPLSVESAVRPLKQMQKLSSITVNATSEGETIATVMAPAPISAEQDPDADSVDDTDSGDA